MENVPFTLLLLAIVEIQNNIPSLLTRCVGCAFTIGRIAHGYSFSQLHDGQKYVVGGTHARFRKAGMVLTLVSQGVLSGFALYCGVISYLNN